MMRLPFFSTTVSPDSPSYSRPSNRNVIGHGADTVRAGSWSADGDPLNLKAAACVTGWLGLWAFHALPRDLHSRRTAFSGGASCASLGMGMK